MGGNFAPKYAVRSSVYISMANTPQKNSSEKMEVEDAIRRFAKALEAGDAFPSIRSAFQYFEAEDHGSVPLLSMYYGLLHVFEGYKRPLVDLLSSPPL